MVAANDTQLLAVSAIGGTGVWQLAKPWLLHDQSCEVPALAPGHDGTAQVGADFDLWGHPTQPAPHSTLKVACSTPSGGGFNSHHARGNGHKGRGVTYQAEDLVVRGDA